jgi:hypothetical protein
MLVKLSPGGQVVNFDASIVETDDCKTLDIGVYLNVTKGCRINEGMKKIWFLEMPFYRFIDTVISKVCSVDHLWSTRLPYVDRHIIIILIIARANIVECCTLIYSRENKMKA